MNIFQRIYKALAPEVAERNRNILQSLYGYFGAGLPSISYQNFNQLIKQGYQKNVDVFSVINWIGEQAAEIPLRVQQLKGGQWEFVTTHPLQKLIDRPNPYQSGVEQRTQIYGFYNVTGNAFVYAPRIEIGMNQGQTQELWVLPSQSVEIITGGWFDPIRGYQLSQGYRRTKEMKFEEVMHLRTANLDFGEGREFWGMSPLRAGLLALDRSNANYAASATMFKTMGMSGIISEEQPEFSGTLTDEQRESEQERIDQDYNGVLNHGKTMITNAKVNYTKLGLSSVDMNLLMDKRATLRF